jgi:hypothetical protein
MPTSSSPTDNRQTAREIAHKIVATTPRPIDLVFDSDTIPRDRRAELESAVVAAGRHLQERFEGWIVANPDRRRSAVRITSYPEVDISVF